MFLFSCNYVPWYFPIRSLILHDISEKYVFLTHIELFIGIDWQSTHYVNIMYYSFHFFFATGQRSVSCEMERIFYKVSTNELLNRRFVCFYLFLASITQINKKFKVIRCLQPHNVARSFQKLLTSDLKCGVVCILTLFLLYSM